MSITPLSQRDPKWKYEKLGFSQTTTIGSHGCTITTLAMLANLTPLEINDKLKVNGYASQNLIIWEKINKAIPWLLWTYRGYKYEDTIVKKTIEQWGACMVEVSGQKIGGIKHWVLFIGNGEIIDPWDGKVKKTNYYGQPLGYAIIEVISNNMPENIQERLDICTEEHLAQVKRGDQLQEKVDQYRKEREELKQVNENYKTQVISLEEKVKEYENYKALSEDRKMILEKLGTTLDCDADFQVIIGKVETLITDEFQALTNLDNLHKEYEKYKQEKTLEIESLKAEIRALKNENDQLATKIDNLSEKIASVESEQHNLAPLDSLFEKIKNLFKRKNNMRNLWENKQVRVFSYLLTNGLVSYLIIELGKDKTLALVFGASANYLFYIINNLIDAENAKKTN